MKRVFYLFGILILLVLVSCTVPVGPSGAIGSTGPSGTPIPIKSITIADGGIPSIKYNGTLQFTANVQPANATNHDLIWSVIDLSGNPATGAVIEPNGVLVGTNGGNVASENVTVTASANDGSGVESNAVASHINLTNLRALF